MKRGKAAPDPRRGNLLRALRISLLAYLLVMVALTAWLAKARSTDWDDTLYMAIYPVNGDRSERTRDYLATLDADAYASVAEFFAREGARHGLALEQPLAIDVGTETAEAPPAPPASGNPLAIAWWSLHLRWVAWRTEHAQSLPSPDIRMFVVYYDPRTHERLAHSLGLAKGLIGVVNAFAARDYNERNGVVIAHETLHTLGATDKYDPATSLPRFPEGYADPERTPLHPQRAAEIMGGRIALSPEAAEMPERLALCVVGTQTAEEIPVAPMSVLRAQGLRVAVGARVLVDQLDLELAPGDLLVILGRNGTGKTLLLHTLAGLRPPAAGQVLLDARPLPELGRRRLAQRLGLLLQIYDDAFPLCVLDAVLVGRHPHLGFWQWEGTVDHAIARAALAAMDLEGMEDRAVGTLSGGERRRLAIATLLAQQPAVHLLDEPLNHLDPQHQIAVLEHYSALARAGHVVAATLHDPNLAARFGTRALLLHGDGRWLCGAIPDVLTAAHLSALFRTPIVQVPAQIGAVFVSGGPG